MDHRRKSTKREKCTVGSQDTRRQYKEVNRPSICNPLNSSMSVKLGTPEFQVNQVQKNELEFTYILLGVTYVVRATDIVS